MAFVVAIDGPAGTGKGTVAKILAKELNFTYIDTGAMYRAVSIEVLNNRLDLENIFIELEDKKVYLNKEDVTEKIRSKEITNIVSQVSENKEIRKKLVDMQRKMAEDKNVIMEGRDIGTVVFPNANVKIYLDAKQEERARRRYIENVAKGINTTYEEVLEHFKFRDKNDMEKEIGALKQAEDAIYIDTTELSIEAVVNKIKNIIEEKS